jgi:radical SAM protein with 4Fe4S-binding SPASM domain
VIQRQAGINDGKGFVFISHTGEIYPSGFLPVSAGNVRRDSLAAVYRESSLFQSLRDASRLEGKCGVCEYRNLCGGSRSRSYALTGNMLAEEARCVYVPAQKPECGPRPPRRGHPLPPIIIDYESERDAGAELQRAGIARAGCFAESARA